MTVRRVNDISTQMRDLLAASEPELDTTIGTPIRKILDAVAEVVAEAYVDTHLLDYQYDIDLKTGADLDEFVRLFGFNRFPAKRATGTVVLERSTAAVDAILIPVNTQFSTDGSSPIVVQTTTPVLLLQGETSVQVPAQASVGGSQGNITANALRRRISPLEGVNSFTNITAFTGGADPESDEQLRDRFKRTVFRSMAGTAPMFLGVALADPSVTQANVIGATKVRREQIDLVSGTATSTVEDAFYIYPNSQIVGVDIDNGNILTPDVHYEFDNSVNPPVVNSLDGTAAPDGVYDLVFEYVPISSRNDPENGVTNRVDIYVNGTRATEATEVVVFRDSRVFVDGSDEVLSPLYVDKFERPDGDPPEEGNFFLAYAFAPVLDPSLSGVIEVESDLDLVEGVDFFLINDISKEGGTPSSLSGIEIISEANGGTEDPVDLSLFQVNYTFNAVPRDIEEAARAWRLITTDVKVHQARAVLLNLYMAIILESGYSFSAVVSDMEQELSNFISEIGFNGVLQVSDLMEVAGRVSGVDAVRFLNNTDDAVNYAIQWVGSDGTTIIETFATGGRADDSIFSDDSYPVLNDLTVIQKAQNSWGQV